MFSNIIKKSVASKLFFMNLFILISIVASQLVFQSIYFEKYYINNKKEKLDKAIIEFENILKNTNSTEEIVAYIQGIKSKEGIGLAFREENLNYGISLESYMGEYQVVITDKKSNKKYKVVLGEQYNKEKIKKGDYIEVFGSTDNNGYIFPRDIIINGVPFEPLYNIIPSGTLHPAVTKEEVEDLTPKENADLIVYGKIEEIINEDRSYFIFGNLDSYLYYEDKNNIMSNEKYVARTKTLNSVNDILLSSKKTSGGYIIAISQISEVKDIFETMNNYYVMIFIVALIIVTIISIIYSRYMTKPLIKMSNIARKISECDFSNRYDVKGEDEISILGNSLNLISHNLEKSLSELKYVNEKLKNEMNIKRLQEENRKELIANISHELKTPITIIQGSLEGIKSGIYSEDIYEDIIEETIKLNDLVKEMLDVSKLESPTFELKKEAFDLGSIFLKEKDKLKSMIRKKCLTIKYNVFDEAIAFGDEKRINQVITNMLTNAIKYTPEGEKIQVDISLNDNNEYVFSVENFGITLSKEEIDKIWDPFYRKEKSRNKKFGGTGLGLSIVKRILEIHSSDFGVESSANSVRFYFTIPKCMAY